MNEAFLNPEILVWGRRRAKLTIAQLAHLMRASEAQIHAWEQGSTRPAFTKAMQIAKVLKLPFASLFLSQAPDSDVQVPDLRTVGLGVPRQMSTDLIDVLQNALLKQQWFSNHLSYSGGLLPDFVGRFKITSPISQVVSAISKKLDLGAAPYRSVSDASEYLKVLVSRAEDAGILVLRSGVVGASNKRRLEVKEFRGFALADKAAPLVFVNTNDAKVAQVFTFIHELAHIWIGTSGVSDIKPQSRDNGGEAAELVCNEIAADFLTPAGAFRSIWSEKGNAKAVATHFRVSEQVVIRRAFDLSLIDDSDFRKKLAEIPNRIASEKKAGGDFHKTLPVRNSALFTRTILASVKVGGTPYREAARLLSVKPGTITKLQERRK